MQTGFLLAINRIFSCFPSVLRVQKYHLSTYYQGKEKKSTLSWDKTISGGNSYFFQMFTLKFWGRWIYFGILFVQNGLVGFQPPRNVGIFRNRLRNWFLDLDLQIHHQGLKARPKFEKQTLWRWLYGCFRNWLYPQKNTPTWSFLVRKPMFLLGKPTILGNPQYDVTLRRCV